RGHFRNVREYRKERAAVAGNIQLGHAALEVHQFHRAVETATARGIFQYFQPSELRARKHQRRGSQRDRSDQRVRQTERKFGIRDFSSRSGRGPASGATGGEAFLLAAEGKTTHRRSGRPLTERAARFFSADSGAVCSAGHAVDFFDDGDAAAAFFAVAKGRGVLRDGAEEIFENGFVAADVADDGRRSALVGVAGGVGEQAPGRVAEIGGEDAIVFEDGGALRAGDFDAT